MEQCVERITPIRKHTLNLFQGDFGRLTVLFPKAGAGRSFERWSGKFVLQVEEQAQQNSTPSPIGSKMWEYPTAYGRFYVMIQRQIKLFWINRGAAQVKRQAHAPNRVIFE